MTRLFLFLTVFVLFSANSFASQLIVATASNALKVARELARSYQELEGVKVEVVSGSTGKLYAQIVNGAPYDVFLSADSHRPRLLEERGIGIKGSRFTYARGILVVWVKEGLPVDSLEDLLSPQIRLIAIANPATAPYGRAAVEALKNTGLFEELKGRLLYGENVSQALGFALTGNADAAIVALASVHGTKGKVITIEPSLYSPIEQDAIALKESPQALGFVRFLKSPAAVKILKEYGYLVPSSF